ncbi:MAG: hypothetical protein LGR52_02885 [Candidatus Thiosymbion ectosymbiont of Robbea hypermnestra]|nr:hypothetical protein [Candidatus Thiosymbion ectosymbiont of Robbea hypermnestra]
MSKLIFKEGKKYTFSDYFDLSNPTEEIAGEFGYSFETKILDLPIATDKDEILVQVVSITAHDYRKK